MNNFLKNLLVSFFLTTSISAFATTVRTNPAKVTFIESYTQAVNGDVVFNIDSPLAGCENGFWLSTTDAGFAPNMAILLSAMNRQSWIVVNGQNDQMWPGSGGKFCKLYSIELR